MTPLPHKVQHALDESRLLIIGAQVLLGFQSRAAFEPGFERLSRAAQYLNLGALGLMLAAVALLIAPAAYHRLVEAGEDTDGLHRVTTRVLEVALLPFALGLGLNLFLAAEPVGGRAWGTLAGLAATGVALACWYGPWALHRTRGRPVKEAPTMPPQELGPAAPHPPTAVHEKIQHVLTETRVVLPGTQALLGFQLAIMLEEGFAGLAPWLRHVHLASLACIALSIIGLMTPAAYHRLVEAGEDTEAFHRLAGRLLVAAMGPLALGLCGDVLVVAHKVTGSTPLAVGGAAALLALCAGLWFGWPLAQRRSSRHARTPSRSIPRG
jgi:hypothetical protein